MGGFALGLASALTAKAQDRKASRTTGRHLDQFRHADWQTGVAEIKKFGSAGKKTAVVSTINGDANVPFLQGARKTFRLAASDPSGEKSYGLRRPRRARDGNSRTSICKSALPN